METQAVKAVTGATCLLRARSCPSLTESLVVTWSAVGTGVR